MRRGAITTVWREWRATLAWTTLGPLGCTLAALGYNALLFHGLGPLAQERAFASATILPLVLGVPLFLVFSLKLKELAAANRKLGITAATDGLTACLNRAAFTATVEMRLERHLPATAPAYGALLIVDADKFKAINDSFGHHAGDTALKLIAQAIRTSVRKGDPVGRLGGEEFGIFLPAVDRAIAQAVAERVRHAVESIPFAPEGIPHPLSVSVGGVVFDTGAHFEDLFKQADIQLYGAKRSGRNRVHFAYFAQALAPT